MPSTNIGTLGKNVQRWLIVYPFQSKKFTFFFLIIVLMEDPTMAQQDVQDLQQSKIGQQH